jgi:hypothetical protein
MGILPRLHRPPKPQVIITTTSSGAVHGQAHGITPDAFAVLLTT